MPTVTPFWKLRRLAPRAIRIVNRLAGNSKYLVLFQKTLVPKAQAYMTAYDQNTNAEAARKKEMKEGRTAITALLKQMQEGSPLLKRDVSGFDGSIFGDQPQVPDDVIEDGERMLDLVETYRDSQGNPLEYQQLMLEQLGAAVQAATKEWAEAETANSQHQKGFAEVRRLGEELQTELVALRRCLMVVVGHRDLNYQKLRVDRAGYPDEDDDPNAPPPPTPVAPAAPGATVQPSERYEHETAAAGWAAGSLRGRYAGVLVGWRLHASYMRVRGHRATGTPPRCRAGGGDGGLGAWGPVLGGHNGTAGSGSRTGKGARTQSAGRFTGARGVDRAMVRTAQAGRFQAEARGRVGPWRHG